MKRAVAGVVGLALAAGIVFVAVRTTNAKSPCGDGFARIGARCCPAPARAGAPGTCVHDPGAPCPAPLVATASGCDARERDVVDVPATTAVVGPSDWEAEGRVAPRTLRVGAFMIDRLEVTVGRFCAARPGAAACGADPPRAVSGVPFDEARAWCKERGGRLPTEDEWLAAAGGERPRRYPWGDTGAVCRRAAWGLSSGPCAEGATGPDTVGAHSEGMTPLGIHDLAGNVAEWVEAPCAGECPRIARGGSWQSRLATELRTWPRREVSADVARRGDVSIGFRCAYDR